MGSHSRSDDRESSRHKHSRDRSGDADEGSSSSKKHRSSSHRSSHHHRDRDEDDRKHGSSSSSRHGSSRKNGSSSSHRSKSKRDDVSKSRDQADREEEEDEWVEKDTTTATQPERAPVDTVGTFSVGSMPTSTAGLRRMEPTDLTDGYGEGDVGGSNERGGGLFGGIAPSGNGNADEAADFFGSFGTERRRKEPKEKVDPADTMGQSSRELNKAYWQGAPPANAASSSSAAATAAAGSSTPKSGSPAPGSSGSAWRMTKLKRTYEAAEEEGRSIEDVALERYGSLEAFEEAKEERRVLDERGDRRKSRRESGYGAGSTPSGTRTPTGMTADGGGRRFVFTDMDASGDRPTPTSRQSFRRPGETPPAMPPRTTSSSSSVAGGPGTASNSRPSTPIPSVFTPPIARRTTSALSQSTVLAPDPTSTGPAAAGPSSSKPILSQSELNKLQARVLKAKLMDSDDAAALEAEYELERKRSLEAGPAVAEHEGMEQSIGGNQKLGEGVQVLPTLDGRGRMYDVGVGTSVADQYEAERAAKGKRAKKEPKFKTRDPKTGEMIRQNADDDELTLDDLVRQERFSGGMNDQRALDTEVANRIATDARYSTDLDYIDDNAEKFARKKMKSEALKRAFAVGDYARTKKALDSCTMCYSDEGEPPKAPVVALGTRTYLALMENEELVPGHCRIVPVQHYLSCLEIDEEEGWDEIKNFMKTLMQMFANEDKGVVFFETIVSHKYQKHSYIEAVPVPFDLFDQLPIYFSEAIQTSEGEWSQHKKLISFSPSRPFRRALVPNLPYFAVQFDYKGEKGYGHIIEGVDDAPDRDLDGEESKGQVGDKGGGEFTRFFAHEIIGNLMSLEPRKWRKPRRIDRRENTARISDFRKKYDRYDWTKMLAQSGKQEDVEAGPSRF